MVEHNQSHLHMPPNWWTWIHGRFICIYASCILHLADAGPTRRGPNVKAFYGSAESVSEKKGPRKCRTATLRTVSVSNGCENISKAKVSLAEIRA